MRWSIPLLVFVASVLAEELAPVPRPVGVVYLLTLINEPKNNPETIDQGINNEIPKDNVGKSQPAVLLIQAIPDTEDLSDGVYFRPADDKPLSEPEVNKNKINKLVFHQFP